MGYDALYVIKRETKELVVSGYPEPLSVHPLLLTANRQYHIILLPSKLREVSSLLAV